MAIAAAFLGGLVLCFGLIVLVEGRSEVTGVVPTAAIGGPFRLTDQDGRLFTDQDLKGKSFLVFFRVHPLPRYSVRRRCSSIGTARRNLQCGRRSKTAAVFITVDPERDTPATLKDYLSNFDPHLRGLTGDPADIAAVAKAHIAHYRKVPLEGGDYNMDHTAIVYLMDKQGRSVLPFEGLRGAWCRRGRWPPICASTFAGLRTLFLNLNIHFLPVLDIFASV